MFSPDGLRVATASWDGTAVVWDVFTGQALTPPLKHAAAVTFLGFSGDGRRLVTASHDRTARIWNLPAEERPPAGLAAWAQVVSGQRIDQTGAAVPLDPTSWRTALSKLRSKYPTDLGLAEEQTLSWHRVEAGQAETQGQWSAAAFHLARLAAALPKDKALRNRHSSAEAEVIRAAEARAKARPPGQRPGRDPKAGPELVDLSNFYNDHLAPPHWRELIGAMPHGLQLLAGTPFDVRGVIVLAGKPPAQTSFPPRVNGIPVGQKCQRLHFLQATAQGGGLAEESAVGTYVVHFADGQKREIPIRYGDDVADWLVAASAPLEIKGSVVAWTGTCAAAQGQGGFLRLFKTTLENPLPAVEIRSIDFVSANTEAMPVLMAITAEP